MSGLELSGPTRQQGGETRYRDCPSCGGGQYAGASWGLSLNENTGAWICYRCGAKGVVDTGITADKLLVRLTPTTSSPVEWPEVPLPKWRSLTRSARMYLRNRGINNPDALGIVETAECGRVIIPYYGSHGKIIYWVNRAFIDDGKPKYDGATGQKPPFILPEWKQYPAATFVEGPFDAIVHWLATGIPTIAIGGKSISPPMLTTIKHLVPYNRTLILDHDALGASLKLAQALDATLIRMPPGVDPAEHWKEKASESHP